MTHRVALPSPRGTLFKQPQEVRRKLRALPRAPQDAEHLDAIRQCPCLVCFSDQKIEAAHVRLGSHAGLGRKANDKYVLPLCHDDHMDQHSTGEMTFWEHHKIPARDTAEKLWRLSPNVEAMRAYCFVIPALK